MDTFRRVDVLVECRSDGPLRTAVRLRRNAGCRSLVWGQLLAPLQLAVELVKRFWGTRAQDNAAMNRNIVNVSSTSGAYVFAGAGRVLRIEGGAEHADVPHGRGIGAIESARML